MLTNENLEHEATAALEDMSKLRKKQNAMLNGYRVYMKDTLQRGRRKWKGFITQNPPPPKEKEKTIYDNGPLEIPLAELREREKSSQPKTT